MKLRSILAVVAVAAVSQISAVAAVITFTFNASDNGEYTISKTVDGLTLTLESSNSEGNWFGAQAGGLMLASYYATAQTAFSFYFDKEVSLLSYTISQAAGGSFDISSGDGNLDGNALTVGSHNFDTLILGAGNWADWTGNVSSGYALIQSISVEVVPEPSSVLLLSGALVGGAIAIRRKKKAA